MGLQQCLHQSLQNAIYTHFLIDSTPKLLWKDEYKIATKQENYGEKTPLKVDILPSLLGGHIGKNRSL